MHYSLSKALRGNLLSSGQWVLAASLKLCCIGITRPLSSYAWLARKKCLFVLPRPRHRRHQAIPVASFAVRPSIRRVGLSKSSISRCYWCLLAEQNRTAAFTITIIIIHPYAACMLHLPQHNQIQIWNLPVEPQRRRLLWRKRKRGRDKLGFNARECLHSPLNDFLSLLYSLYHTCLANICASGREMNAMNAALTFL